MGMGWFCHYLLVAFDISTHSLAEGTLSMSSTSGVNLGLGNVTSSYDILFKIEDGKITSSSPRSFERTKP